VFEKKGPEKPNPTPSSSDNQLAAAVSKQMQQANHYIEETDELVAHYVFSL
jgi:hypothetical protein